MLHGSYFMLMLAFLCSACGSANGSPPPAAVPLSTATVRLGSDPYCTTVLKTFSAEIADTDVERYLGLSGRKAPLAENRGMLFEFQSPVRDSFYMRDTYIPLSIGFFDSDRRLVQSFEMPVEKTPSQPTHYYSPESSYMSALEVPPGTFDGLAPGSTYLCVS